MMYKFIKDGKTIETEKEQWCWEAHYNNGFVLKQFDEAGFFHQFKEIDQSKLFAFKMVNDEKCHTLLFDPDKMKLIHYYKRKRLNIFTPDERNFTLYCFGYETNTHGKTNKSILVILPSGETVLTENPDIINFE